SKGENNPPVAKCSNGADTGVHSGLNLTTFAARASQDDYQPDGVTVTGDTISVRFLGDDNLFSDCANGQLPSACRVGNAPSMEAALIYNTFFINNSGGQPTLMCSGTRTPAAAPIAPGIENMQILYGVDSNADNNVDKYVTASNLASSERNRVVSLKVGILVRSLEPVLPAAESHSYQVLDQSISTNDRFQRSVYSTVIHLRNVIDG
ncbi:MAG: PilW family protein, partial [Thiothrix sp.]